MGIEIERKFLVKRKTEEEIEELSSGKIDIIQGIIGKGETLVRARIANDKAFLTLKGKKVGQFGIQEWEYEIPVTDAHDMLYNVSTIHKTRYLVPSGKHTIEVDVFRKKNNGLIIAEVEMEREDEEIIIPDWFGLEVTGNKLFNNSNLVKTPYNMLKLFIG